MYDETCQADNFSEPEPKERTLSSIMNNSSCKSLFGAGLDVLERGA